MLVSLTEPGNKAAALQERVQSGPPCIRSSETRLSGWSISAIFHIIDQRRSRVTPGHPWRVTLLFQAPSARSDSSFFRVFQAQIQQIDTFAIVFHALNRVLIEDYLRAARGASGGGRRVLSAAKIASPDQRRRT